MRAEPAITAQDEPLSMEAEGVAAGDGGALTRRVAASPSWRSLAHRNYRLYFVSQAASSLGTWLQLVAQTLLIYDLTESGTAIGLLSFCQFLPALVLVPWAGAVIDRTDTRRLLTVSSVTMMVAALALGTLTVVGAVTPLAVFLLAMLLGLANTFDSPARRALVNELVPVEDVPNAVSLNSTMVVATRILGPTLAGLLVATVGIGWCFLINGASFVIVLAGLRLMDAESLRTRAPLPRAPGQVRDGLRYAWGNRTIRFPLLTLVGVGLASMNLQVIGALYVKVGLDGSDTLYATVTAIAGVGAMACGLALARRTEVDPALVARMALGFGFAYIALAAAPSLWWGIVPFAALGFTQLGIMAVTNTVIQVEAAPAMRGRVLALYGLGTMGVTPISGALCGWGADTIGARPTIALAGGVTIVISLVVSASRSGGTSVWSSRRPATAATAAAAKARGTSR